MFFRYNQNNTNGCFIGPQIVFVDAASAEEAEALARSAGVYFDGVETGADCLCCGDRWFREADTFATEAEALATVEAWRVDEDDSPVYRIVRGDGARGA